MKIVFVPAIAVEFHGRVVMGRRDKEGEAVEAEDSFDSILPFFVRDVQLVTKKEDFFAGESEFGAQEPTQAHSIWGFTFVTDFAVAGAEFADFVFESCCFFAQGRRFFI